MNNELIIFEAKDKSVSIPVQVDSETVWLNRNQIAELFDRDVKTYENKRKFLLRATYHRQDIFFLYMIQSNTFPPVTDITDG